MNYYSLEPEVSGGLGERTIMDNSKHPPLVHRLHYQFEGWLGDDLLETFPCYLISDNLKEQLHKTKLSGYEISDVEISKSEEFEDFSPNTKLPGFFWLKVVGKVGVDDFSLSADMKLIVSETALDVIQKFNINNCTIESFAGNRTGIE